MSNQGAMRGPQVSASALVQRINRVLKKRRMQLRVPRGARARDNLGEYYIHDLNSNNPVSTHVNIEGLAKKLGVIQEWEHVEGTPIPIDKNLTEAERAQRALDNSPSAREVLKERMRKDGHDAEA